MSDIALVTLTAIVTLAFRELWAAATDRVNAVSEAVEYHAMTREEFQAFREERDRAESELDTERPPYFDIDWDEESASGVRGGLTMDDQESVPPPAMAANDRPCIRPPSR